MVVQYFQSNATFMSYTVITRFQLVLSVQNPGRNYNKESSHISDLALTDAKEPKRNQQTWMFHINQTSSFKVTKHKFNGCCATLSMHSISNFKKKNHTTS